MKPEKLFVLTLALLAALSARGGNIYNVPFDLTEVNAVSRDDKGMMWFGSKYGLYSYNGFNLKKFVNPEYPDGDGACVQVLLPLGERLCVATERGVCFLNLRSERYGELSPALTELGAVRALKMIGGTLWIGTRDAGLKFYDFGSDSLCSAPGGESLIHAIDTLAGDVYTASWEQFRRYSAVSRKGESVRIDGQDIASYALLCDGERGCVWVGGKGALYRYEPVTGGISLALKREGVIIGDIVFDADRSSLVLGTENGIIRFNPETGDVRQVVHDARNQSSLHNNVVRALYRDVEGNVWVGTNRGVSVLRSTLRERLMHISELSDSPDGNALTSILVDSKGEYWLGGENGLIHYYRRGNEFRSDCFRTDSPTHTLRHNLVRSIYEDSDGDIWLATEGSIALYDRLSDRMRSYDLVYEDGSRNSTIAYSIIEDRKGRIWAGAFLGGIFIIDKRQLLRSGTSTVKVPDYFADVNYGNTVWWLGTDDEGDVWAVTRQGLVHIDVETLRMDFKWVWMDAAAYSEGSIWHSTGGRLYRFDEAAGSSELIFNIEGGHIHCIAPCDGGVCITTTDGVYRTDGKTTVPLLVQPRTYNVAYWDRLHRQMILGGNDCVLLASSDGPMRRERALIVAVNGYDGESPRFSSSLKLRRRDDVSFELAADSCSELDDRVFWYRVNGEAWKSLSPGQNLLSFASLGGGEYTVDLSLSDPELDRDALVSSWKLRVPYPWYRRWWAFALYFMLIALSVALLLRRAHLRELAALREKERERSLELSREKMDFFVNMSHELKTPLSLIVAPLSKLIQESRSEKTREALMAVHGNAIRLDALIHRILDFQKYEYETEDRLLRSHIEMRTWLEKLCEGFSSGAVEQGAELSFSSGVESLWMNVDLIKMESAVSNLISNALKHVPKTGGKVAVSLSADGEKACIEVRDNGPGIRESDIPLVFIRFYQGSQAASTKANGSGIGLYIVRKYVELHGGTVSLRNSGGLVADIRLPLSGENVPGEVPELELPAPEEGKKSILIVDDNAEIVAFLADALSGHYSCFKAYSGEAALDSVARISPDLVIVDYMMPGMSGLDFVKRLRKEIDYSDIPVIMLTAKDDEQTELESIRAGIDAFFPKPFSLHKLQLRIAQIFRQQDNRSRREGIAEITSRNIPAGRTPSPDEQLMEKITAIIEENMENEEFGVNMLSRLSGLESRQLYRKVKQLTGETPVNYIRKLRIRKAASLLAQGSFTVSEVMYMVGYSNASYFSRCFAQEYGISPRQMLQGDLSD